MSSTVLLRVSLSILYLVGVDVQCSRYTYKLSGCDDNIAVYDCLSL